MELFMHLLPWYLACFAANFCIMYVEYANRSYPTWAEALPYTVVPIIVAQWGLYVGFSGAPSWYMAWAVFTVGNSAMRAGAVSMMAGHEIASWPLVLAGVAGMLGCALLVKQGLH